MERKKNPLWDQKFHPERVAIHIAGATPDREAAGINITRPRSNRWFGVAFWLVLIAVAVWAWDPNWWTLLGLESF